MSREIWVHILEGLNRLREKAHIQFFSGGELAGAEARAHNCGVFGPTKVRPCYKTDSRKTLHSLCSNPYSLLPALLLLLLHLLEVDEGDGGFRGLLGALD